MIRRIKELLYEEGYTIAGAKKRLQSELEEGRSFAAPEVDGELFTAEGEDDDDVPVIPVEAGGEVESGRISGGPNRRGARGGARVPDRAGAARRLRSNPGRRLLQPRPTSRRVLPSRRSSRRSRGKAAAKVEAKVVEGAAREVAAAPRAVDSALSERVETLEHGLRRVLAEVRHLRELLADPGSDR